MIKVKFIKEGIHYKCLSNFIDKDIDLLELLLLDLNTFNEINSFENIVFLKNKNYWKETVKINIEKDEVIFIENYAFDENYIASKIMSKKNLQEILNDWKIFLKIKNEFEMKYF